MPVIFLLFVLFGIWLHVEKSKASRITKQSSESFWATEHKADLTRKEDISHLPYLSLDLDMLPIHHNTTDSTLQDYYMRLDALQDKKILHLSSQSNTELKMLYGKANLDFLCQCDQAYTSLIVTLNKWGCYLYEKEQYDDALLVLEYALKCNSDISTTYITLAKLYLLKQDSKSIDTLLEQAQNLTTKMKDKIISTIVDLRLKDMLLTSDHTEI